MARITLPVDLTVTDNYLLDFWYHMFGTGIGKLVVEATKNGVIVPIWERSGAGKLDGDVIGVKF